MMQANMHEAKTELSRLVKALESHEEDVVYIARNGQPIVQMTLVDLSKPVQRIGVAEGKFTVPDDFDSWDSEVEELFEVM